MTWKPRKYSGSFRGKVPYQLMRRLSGKLLSGSLVVCGFSFRIFDDGEFTLEIVLETASKKAKRLLSSVSNEDSKVLSGMFGIES